MGVKDKTRKASELRERFKQPTGRPMDAWLRANPAAKEFIELWLVMAAKRDSDWNISKVHRELISVYGLPVYRDLTNFKRWMLSEYGRRFDEAYEAIR